MKITKKRKNQNYTNYANTEYKEYKNIEDINNKIKEIDNKINEITFNINKNGNDKINTTNNKEKILNENNNNKNNISIEEIKYEFININKRLDEIIKIINNEIKNDNKSKIKEITKNKEIFNYYKTKNVIVYQDNICIIPTPLEKTKITKIPILIREENKIQKIEEFEFIKNEKNVNIKNKNKNYKFKNLPLIKKNIIYQIKRVETFEIIKNKKNFNGNKKLPLIKKPLNYQIINQIYIPGIPGINNPEENIQKADENELLRIYLPIPEFVIEDINDFVLYALKKNPLLIQYNSQIEFKSKK